MRRPAILASVVVILSALAGASPPAEGGPGDDRELRVGILSDLYTRNILHGGYHDTSSVTILDETVYDTVVKIPPDGVVRPYILKGVDADGDGVFQADEYGVFARDPVDWQGNPCASDCLLHLIAFYDFNGIFFHDGAQADVYDLFFSYHAAALSYRLNNGLRVLMDPMRDPESLGVTLVEEAGTDWALPLPAGANAANRASVRFDLTEPYAQLSEETLNVLLLPRHVWEKTGQHGKAPAPVTATAIHADLGCLVYPPTASGAYTDTSKRGRGIPAGASDMPADCSSPFRSDLVGRWAPTDADVIGSGAFRLDAWVAGSHVTVSRHDRYFVGRNPDNPSQVWDPQLVTLMALPLVGSIRFRVFTSQGAWMNALLNGEIDTSLDAVPPRQLENLITRTDIGLEARPERGFIYMAYNFRRLPWGYDANGQDVGLTLRGVFARLIDRERIVRNLLLNLGEVGYSMVSPANRFWHNPAVQSRTPPYDPNLAGAILDAMGWGPDPPGDCSAASPTQCRTLPSIGNAPFYILTPTANYDPVRAGAGQYIAHVFQSVGLNMNHLPLEFGEIVARLDAKDFDQYILAWSIGGTDPDYLFSFLHSSNADFGQNYPGWENATFDQLIEDSRREMNRSLRREMVFRAQELLTDAHVYEVLYHRLIIQAYRSDRWTNWTFAPVSIVNEWSLMGIRPPRTAALSVSIAAPATAALGSAVELTVQASSGGTPAPFASVTVAVASAEMGLVESGGVTGTTVTASADAIGRVQSRFIAPGTLTDRLDATLLVTATHPDFDGTASRGHRISVLPAATKALLLDLDWPRGDIVPAGGLGGGHLAVTDLAGSAVPDVVVTLNADPPIVTLVPAAGSLAEVASFQVEAHPRDDVATVRITATATREGYVNATDAAFLLVQPTAPPHPPVCPPGTAQTSSGCLVSESPMLGTALVILATAIAALAPLGVRRVWRRKQSTRDGP